MKTELKEKWNEIKLEEVGSFLRGPFGSTIKKSVCLVKGKGTYKLYEQGNVIKNDFNRGEYYLDENKFNELKKFEIKSGDILITCAGTLGKIAIVPEKIERGIINSVLMRIRLDKTKIDSKYFIYFFRSSSMQNKISSQSQGVAIKNLFATKELRNFEVSLPPLSTQQKIVSILEKAEDMQNMRKEANKLTKHFLNTIFVEIFGDPQVNNKKWKIVKIGDCIQESQYGTSSKSNDKMKGYPILGMNHISIDGEINLSKYNFVDIPKKEFDRLKLQKGDVLFNRTNSPELIGKTAYWNLDLDAVVASYLVKLKMNNMCDPIFFTFLMNTKYFKEVFYSSSKKAVNQANISPTLLKTFPMYLPPINLQKKFSTILEKIQSLKTHQRNSGKFIDDLFNNLIQKAFKGELAC